MKILRHVRRSGRDKAVLFSDGALAWPAECKVLKLKNKFLFAMGANNSPAEFESRGQEATAGTQVLDRWWQGLDEFVPPQLRKKHEHGENPMLRRYAYAYLWRYHIPNGTNLLDAFGGI